MHRGWTLPSRPGQQWGWGRGAGGLVTPSLSQAVVLGCENFLIWEKPLQMNCYSAKLPWNGDFGQKAQAA